MYHFITDFFKCLLLFKCLNAYWKHGTNIEVAEPLVCFYNVAFGHFPNVFAKEHNVDSDG